jgi:hypothetical protein
MKPASDWSILKSAIEEKKKADAAIAHSEDVGRGFLFNRTDLSVIKSLLSGGMKLADLRAAAGRSRVSVYLSIKKLKASSILEEKDGVTQLVGGDFSDSVRALASEGFVLDSLIGERMLVLESFLEGKSIERVAVECSISSPSVYKYVKELKILLERSDGVYKLREDNPNLRRLASVMKEKRENALETFQIWSSVDGKLLKTKGRLEGALTAFSRFPDYKIPVSSGYDYYFVPKKELEMEEIFVHSIRCAEGEDSYSKVREFFIKNSRLLDVFSIDELSLRFDVADSWLDLQAQVAEMMEKEKMVENMDLNYLSPENIFFSNSIANECGSILKCESVLKRESLCWDMLLREYIIQQKDPNFRWQALLSRFQILERRAAVKIPIYKKLSKTYLESAINHSLKKPKSVEELRDELRIQEYQLRNILAGMSRKGYVQKVGKKPIRFEISPHRELGSYGGRT